MTGYKFHNKSVQQGDIFILLHLCKKSGDKNSGYLPKLSNAYCCYSHWMIWTQEVTTN